MFRFTCGATLTLEEEVAKASSDSDSDSMRVHCKKSVCPPKDFEKVAHMLAGDVEIPGKQHVPGLKISKKEFLSRCCFSILKYRLIALTHDPCPQVSKPSSSSKKTSKPGAKAASSKVAKTHLKEVGPGVFKGYNLKALGVPKEAWPNVGKPYKGIHGYTKISEKTNAVACWLQQALFHVQLNSKYIFGSRL